MRYAVLLGTSLLGSLLLTACDVPKPEADTTPSAMAGTTEIAMPESRTAQEVMQMWSRSCALCHVTGNAGAPRIGNADEWRSRLAQGEATLLQHTVEGFNDMPPLGYCMACERDDLLTMIQFMATGSMP